MKKRKICLFILLIIVLSSISIISYGALSYSITSGISSIELGKTYTVTIKATGLTGRFNISHSDNVTVNTSSVWVENGVADSKIVVTTKAEGKATVTFSPETVASAENGELVELASKTDTVTVKAASTNTGNSNNTGNNNTTTTVPTFTSKNQTVYATGSANIRASYSTSSAILGTVKKGDTLTRIGIATKSVNGVLWSKISYNGKTAYITSEVLTTTKPVDTTDPEEPEDNDDNKDDEKKSTNKNLQSLSVVPTGLTPAFNSSTTDYTMTVGSDIEKIEVKAVAEDSKANVQITGNHDLKIGKNTIKITVTAEDKSTKIYNIIVTKEEKVQLKLKELLIEGMPLQPQFDSNIYEYTLTLDKSDVSELNITATANKDNAEVEILGNTDLKPGVNIITVLVKSANGEETTTYQITVTLPEAKVAVTKEDNKDLMKYALIGVGGVAIVIFIIIMIVKHNNSQYNEFDIDDEEEPVEEVKGNFGMERTEKKVQVEDLLELKDEDLPKSLRKDKEEAIEGKKEQEMQEMTDRSKKIDELYASMNDEEYTRKKKGKHF